MKKAFLLNLAAISVITSALSISAIAQVATTDQDKANAEKVAQGIKEAQNKAVTTKISTFNGTVTVKTGDQTVELMPGEAVETLKGVMEKKPISWADVAAYEEVIANQEPMDPKKFQFTRWILENIQTRRINRVLDELKAKLKKQYQEAHNGKIPRDDTLSSYLPGKTDQEKKDLLGKVINQVVEQLGLDPTGPLTHDGWQTKLVSSTDTLHYVDVNKLCELAGIKITAPQQFAEEAQNLIKSDPEKPSGK